MKHTLTPLNPPYSDEISKALSVYPQKDGYVLKLFRVFANSHRFLTGKGVVNLLDTHSPISLRQRELVILRVCANNHCEYEWGVHKAVFGEAAELTEREILLTTRAALSEQDWVADDFLLLQSIDQLCQAGDLDAHIKDRFRQTWTLDQQLEILALCGNYHTISFVANLSNMTNEAFAASFPS